MSTNVKLNISLSGTTNGKPWPEQGSVVKVDDDVAAHLIAAGHAEEAGKVDGEVVDLTAPVYAAQVEADGTAKVERAAPAKRETRQAAASS